MSHDHDIVKTVPSRVNSSNGIINVMRWNNLTTALFLQNNNIDSVIKHYYKGKTNHVRLEANYCNVVHNVIELGTCMCNIYCAVFNAWTCYYTLSLRIIRVVTYTTAVRANSANFLFNFFFDWVSKRACDCCSDTGRIIITICE